MSGEGKEYFKGLMVGSIIGGAVGAVIALLFAPKSGKELRKDIAEITGELYQKTSNYFTDVQQKVDQEVWETVNEGRQKAQNIIDAAKQQAKKILDNAEKIIEEAKEKAKSISQNVEGTIEQIKEATKAGVEAFKSELKQ